MSTFNELIDFTRSTTGTYLDSVVYGNELVTNGTFDTDSDWIKTGNLTAISNGTATIGETAGNGSIRQENALIAGKSYIVKFDITAVSSASAFLAFRNDEFSSVGSAVISFGSSLSVATYSKVFVATGSIVNFTVGGGNSNLTIDNVSVKEVIGGQGTAGTPLLRTAAINEPRLEYDASGNPLGLLIEEQRNNLLSYSEAFDNVYWSKESTNVISDQTVAPDGTNSADKIIEANTTNTFHFVTRSVSVSAGAKTFSAYFKKGERNFAALTLRVDSGSKRLAVIFDLTNGTVADTLTFGSPTQTNSTIENAGNGWYRCSITAYHSTGNVIALLSPQDDGNGGGTINMDYAGTVGYGVYAWGAQFEEGAFPTSYIPTSGSTVTRAADIASLPVERFAYNDTKGSVVVSASSFANLSGSNNGYVAVLSDGTSNNRMQVVLRDSSQGFITGGLGLLDAGSVAQSQTTKIAMAVKTNDAGLSLNGGAVVTATSGNIPSPITDLRLGGRTALDSATLCGHIKHIQYFPKRLSNEKLELLTQPSASPTMNLTFDGQATSTLVEGLHD